MNFFILVAVLVLLNENGKCFGNEIAFNEIIKKILEYEFIYHLLSNNFVLLFLLGIFFITISSYLNSALYAFALQKSLSNWLKKTMVGAGFIFNSKKDTSYVEIPVALSKKVFNNSKKRTFGVLLFALFSFINLILFLFLIFNPMIQLYPSNIFMIYVVLLMLVSMLIVIKGVFANFN